MKKGSALLILCGTLLSVKNKERCFEVCPQQLDKCLLCSGCRSVTGLRDELRYVSVKTYHNDVGVFRAIEN